MKKFAFVALLLAFAVLASCASKPEPSTSGAAPVSPGPAYKIVNNQNADFGGSVPSWVTANVFDLENNDPSYKDMYVFKFEGTGSNLEGTKLKVDQLNAAAEIARYISLRVKALFTGAQVGDDKDIETYMENVVNTLAQVTVTGFRKVDSFWVQRQYFDDGRLEYSYRVLYTIPQSVVKKLMNDAADTVADSPEKETAKDRVKKIMEGNLPALSDN